MKNRNKTDNSLKKHQIILRFLLHAGALFDRAERVNIA
tara:strand:+ start:1058 stop:1171 length:114 start_codon:yes stop_codon:yes gene_type:complete